MPDADAPPAGNDQTAETARRDDRWAAPGPEPERGDRRGSFLREIPVLVLVALVLAIVIKTFLVQAFFIPSESMEPTLMPGDRVLVSKVSYRFGEIHRGNVVVFKNPHPGAATNRGWLSGLAHWLGAGLGLAQPPDEDLIKRVVGLPGDLVQIRRNVVYVNGSPLTEPYLTDAARACNGEFPKTRVPVGDLWVLGDNRCNSGDSRFGLGFVPEHDVIGHAFVIIWPPGDASGL